MLEMVAVSLVSGREPVLIRASLTVRPGERLSILGLSATGRSALFRFLEGGQSDAGDVRLDGRPLREARRAKAAIVRAGGEGYPVSGRSARQALERAGGPASVSDAAARAGLHGKLDTPVKLLDLDQRVRLGIACAVAQKPRLLLLDAPAAGLMDHDRDRFLADLPKLVRLPDAMIVLAGSADEALALGGQALILDRGQAVHTGTVREAFDRPATLAAACAVAGPGLNLLAIGEGGVLADGSRFNPPPGLRLPERGSSTLAFRADDASLERRGPDCLRFAARASADPSPGRYIRLVFAGGDWLVPASGTPLTPGIVTSVFVPIGRLMVFDSDGRAAP